LKESLIELEFIERVENEDISGKDDAGGFDIVERCEGWT
jgi:hypothetical protein